MPALARARLRSAARRARCGPTASHPRRPICDVTALDERGQHGPSRVPISLLPRTRTTPSPGGAARSAPPGRGGRQRDPDDVGELLDFTEDVAHTKTV